LAKPTPLLLLHLTIAYNPLMAKVAKLTASNGQEILIEVYRGSTAELASVKDKIIEAKEELSDAWMQIKAIAVDFQNGLSDAQDCISSAELELGVELSGEGRWIIASVGAKVSFKVKITLDFKGSAPSS
jgi:hypothetical protein